MVGEKSAAAFWMVWLVMWDHFPRDFFKYVAILAAIGILGAFLTWAIRSSARPRKATLLKCHREAYQNHRCPKLYGEAPSQTESPR